MFDTQTVERNEVKALQTNGIDGMLAGCVVRSAVEFATNALVNEAEDIEVTFSKMA